MAEVPRPPATADAGLRANGGPPQVDADGLDIDRDVLRRVVDRVVRPVIIDRNLLAWGGDEGYHHHKVLPKTTALLTRESIEADPVGSVVEAIKAHVNLLSQFQEMKSRTLLLDESTDPDDVRDRVLDLLYGDDDLAGRVDRFVAWGAKRERADGAEMWVDATVASYLLGTSQPDRYAFCKPSVYKAAARALVGEAVGAGRLGERVAHATRLYRAVLDILRDEHGLPFGDLFHVHIAFYVVLKYEGGGWDPVEPEGTVAEPVVPYGVDVSRFVALFDRFVEEFAAEDRGAEHLDAYRRARADAKRRLAEICAAADAGEDVTDAVLLGLLPHRDTEGNRARGAWVHPAAAVTRDVREWFEGAGWAGPDDWPHIAGAVLALVRTCADAPDRLGDAIAAFVASPYSKGLQAGMLSPVLSALRPDAFSLINSKAVRLVNRLTGADYPTRLANYPEANAAAQGLAAVAEGHVEDAAVDAEAVPDMLDMMAHWLVTEGPPPGPVEAVRPAPPLDGVFASVEEAEWGLDLFGRVLGLLGVDGPGDPRAAISMPQSGRGELLRLTFGNWWVFDVRGGGSDRAGVSVALARDEGARLPVGDEVGLPFAGNEGEPEYTVFRFDKEDVRPMSDALDDVFEASMTAIGERFATWAGNPYRAAHRPALEAAVFDDDARDGVLRDGEAPGTADPPPPDPDARVWKVSPGDGAWQWEEARDGGFIGVGWEDLGDLSDVDEDEFRRRQADAEDRFGWTTQATNQVWRFARGIRPGDRVVANRGTSEVLGVGTVTGPYYYADGERHAHRLPVQWDDTTARPVDFYGWRRTLLAVSKADFQSILEAGRRSPPGTAPAYTLAACSAETGVAEDVLGRWVRAVERKGQAVFYGPPGTGKTFLAERLARHLVGGTDGFHETVQFHPAYAYEDFVEGIRPRTVDGQLDYPLEPGRLLQFCERARSREGPCVLVVDEINRANLARVFGELMYLLEYRDRGVTLASGRSFSIPENVRIIGTMNTADRSIALVDHALRRRFAFVRLWPDFGVLRRYHKARGTGFPVDALVGVLGDLNEQIDDPHYAVGISYFLDEALSDHVEDVWRMEIEPYLEEYFFDSSGKVDAFRWPRVAERLGLGPGTA